MPQMLVMGALLTLLLLPWLCRRAPARLRTLVSDQRSVRRLELIERLPLTPHHSLHVVRMDEKLLLIGVSPSGCVLLEGRRTHSRLGEAN